MKPHWSYGGEYGLGHASRPKSRQQYLKYASIIAIALMVAVAFQPAATDADTSSSEVPKVPTGQDYLYVLETQSDNHDYITGVKVSVDGSALVSKYRTGSATDHGIAYLNEFWKFNETTGLGPFNSFYAQINLYSGEEDSHGERKNNYDVGSVAYVMDPANLKKTIGNTDLSQGTSTLDRYNVMLVIPTVYWKQSDDGTKLYLSSKDTYTPSGGSEISGMVAYQHSYDDRSSKGSEDDLNFDNVMPYLAIGVYEGSTATIGTTANVLVSQSGKAPAVSQTHDTFKTYQDNTTSLITSESSAYGSAYQQWNFFQWTLYKMMSYTIMGTKNSQEMIGYGPTNFRSGSQSTTGNGDSEGPYAASPINSGEASSSASYSKLLIENSWGSVEEFVGDTWFNGMILNVGNTLSGQKIQSSQTQYLMHGATLPLTGWITSTHTDTRYWDLPKTSYTPPRYDNHDSLEHQGDCVAQFYPGSWCLFAGGDTASASEAGVAYANAHDQLDWSSPGIGVRPAYLMTADAAATELKISFDAQGHGTAPDAQIVIKNGKVAKPTDLTETGYAFGGWYKDSECTDEWVFDTDTVTADMTLHAKWTEWQLTVTFDANGGSGTMEQQIIKYTDPSKTINSITFTRVGHIFKEWNTDSGGAGTSYADGADVSSLIIAADSTLSLHARWTEWQLTVTFDANGGSGTMEQQIIKYTDSFKILNPHTFIRTGYYFKEWNTDSGGTGMSYEECDDVSSLITGTNSTVSLYAQWMPITYKVTFDSNRGMGSMTDLTLTYDIPQALPRNTFVREGYNYIGWNTQPDGSGIHYDDGQTVSNLASEQYAHVTLYAQWSVSRYTLTFESSNDEWGVVSKHKLTAPYGSEVSIDGNRVTIDDNDVYAYPSGRTPEFTYAFKEWSGIPTTVTEDVTVTAVFDRTVNQYAVTFDAAGGEPVPDRQTVDYGGKASRPTNPSKEGQAFQGWFYDNVLWDFDNDTVKKDMMLVAQWENEYIVTFDPQGHGTAPQSQTLTEGSLVAKPDDLSADGYIFGGWFKESACVNGWKFDTDRVTSPMILYAKWTAAECSVNDGSSWQDYATLEEGLDACRGGYVLRMLFMGEHDSVVLDKNITIRFDDKAFRSSTKVRISSEVTFESMLPIQSEFTFGSNGTLVTDRAFALKATFDDPSSQADRVFVRGLTVSNVAVAHQGYSQTPKDDGLALIRVTDLPFAVMKDDRFAFYSTLEEALDDVPYGIVYVLDYIPVYDGGEQVRSYEVDVSVDRNIVLSTVTRVTDGTYSSFYVDSEEKYNNGRSVAIPEGSELAAVIYGRISVTGGCTLSIGDVVIAQDIDLGGGMTSLLADSDIAKIRLTDDAPQNRLAVGFVNLSHWTEEVTTEEGTVYRLKDGCDYTFITSDRISLNDLVGVNAAGFKANISPGGLSADLAASQSMIGYVHTGTTSYTGHSDLLKATEGARMSDDKTVYILYRTTEKEGDAPTTSHDIDFDVIADGTFRFDTVHQSVDASGHISGYTIDDSISTLVFKGTNTLTVTKDLDLSRLWIDGTIILSGDQLIDLGGTWDGRTVILDLSSRSAGTILKNIGDVKWDITAYPGDGYFVVKDDGDLVLKAPGPVPPEPVPSSSYTMIMVAVVVIVLLLGVACIQLPSWKH